MNKEEKQQFIKQESDKLLIEIREKESKVNAVVARHIELLEKEQKELEFMKLKHEALADFKVK